MSVAKPPGYSIDLSAPEGKRPLEGKDSLDVTDDLDRAASLSYTSHMPLNKNNPAQSTTSLPPQHSASINDLSQPQVDREGLPSQVYYDSHPQSQHTPSTRNSSWDMLGGARKIGQAYEQFDSRNASEQHLAFADGDLPNSKVSSSGSSDTHGCNSGLTTHQFFRFYQFLLNASIVTRWTLFIIPVLAIIWIPGILSLTASPTGKVRFLLPYAHQGPKASVFLQIWGVRLIWWSIWLSVAWGGTIIRVIS